MENPVTLILDLFTRHLWLWLILGTIMSGAMLRLLATAHIREDPSREAGYTKLLWGFLLFMNLPWLVMGAAMIFGGFESIFDVMAQVHTGNPFSLLFLATILIPTSVGFVWVVSFGGADFLARHPNELTLWQRSARLVKLVAGFYLALALMVCYLLWSGRIE